MKRIVNVLCLLSLLASCLSVLAHAEGTVCGLETVLVPDGRLVQSTIPGSTTFWFLASLAAGHTYSVEIKSTTAQWGVSPGTATFFDPSDGCSGTSSLTTTDTHSDDPQEPTTAIRVSFTAPIVGFYRVQLVNSSGSAVAYSIAVTDTTLFSPRWSSFSGFITQYGALNNSNAAISCTLSVIDSAGGSPSPLTFSVPANTQLLKVVGTHGDVVVPANHFGYAYLGCLGPPGAISTDGYFINGSATVIVPAKFEPLNAQH